MTWTHQYCFAFATLVAASPPAAVVTWDSATSAFSKLGLKPELVAQAIPALTSFVTKSGGANVGSLLADALK
jgi:hypothetical protein